MELSIILVNYNDRKHVGECLSSLQKSMPPFEQEILVVDNHSTDGSPEWIAGSFPDVRLISNAENLGFARANNLGVWESRGEYLLFLNTDSVVPPGALAALVDCLKSDAAAGAAGPALLRHRHSFQVSFGRRVDFFAQFRQKLMLNPYHRLMLKRATKIRKTGWLSAACLLCRRRAFEEAGGFDENFFLYFEDIDLCVRMRKAGWKLIYVPHVRVFHEGGATTIPRRAASRFEYRKSQLYFYQKHNSRISLKLLRWYLRLNFQWLAARGAFRGEEGSLLREKYGRLLRQEGRGR
jgi:GT2 family glycosyltransferase